MKKIKKIKNKVNGKIKSINANFKNSHWGKDLKIPIKKVVNGLKQEIINKKNISKNVLKKDDKIEIVHFIGGG